MSNFMCGAPSVVLGITMEQRMVGLLCKDTGWLIAITLIALLGKMALATT